jgi:signal transduction histidine kinase
MGNWKTARVFLAWLALFSLGSSLRVPTKAGAQKNRDDSPRVNLSEAERAWTQEHPVVYWGVDPQWPPFSSIDSVGRISGIDADIVKLIGQRTGLNLQLVQTADWSETLNKATQGQIDFIGGIARTEKRERLLGLQFTEVFCKFPTAIVTRKEMPFLTSLAQLKTSRVAVPRDYATTEELQKRYPEMKLVITENEEEAMLALAGGKAEATVLNLASASHVVHMRGLSNLKISGFTSFEFFLCLAVRRGAPELHSILEKGLATIDPREKEAIYASYILPETRKALAWRTWEHWAIYSALIGLTAVVAVLLWNRSLANEIRSRKSAEAALLQARDRLEEDARELDRQGTEMRKLNQRLTSANEDLESFSYSVSHDLKAPLRHLLGFSQLLEMHTGNALDADARDYLATIHNEGRRMGELIDGLLAFAKIGNAELKIEPVNMELLTKEVVRITKFETQGREIVWEIHSLPVVSGDKVLLKQVIANLVGNAVKFTRKRTLARIEIGVLPQEADGGEVVFYVKDNGAGFDMNFAGALFKTFHRLHSQQEYEGSGIGLANVSRIIRKHGGRIWAESEVDKGATFYFSLGTLR